MQLKNNMVHRLYLVMILQYLVANFAHPITPTLIENLNLNDYMFGVAFACMALTNFLFSPLWGKLSKRIGIVKIIGTCFIGYGLSQGMFALATTETEIIFARLLAGFFIGGLSVNQILYIIEFSSEDKKGSNLAISVTINSVISAFGYMIGGLLGDISIGLTFAMQVIGLISVGVLSFLILKEKVLEPSSSKLNLKEVNPFQVMWDAKVMMNVVIVLFLLISMTTSFASTCYEQSFNYFIRDQYGFPPSYNGLLKALVGFVTLIANSTICIWLMRKTDIKKSIIPVLAVCLLMMISIVLLDDVVPFIIMNVIFFAFNAIYLPLLQTIIGKFKVKDVAVLIGVFNSVRSLGMVIGSLFAGFIYTVHPKLSFVFTAFAFLFAVIFAYMFYTKSQNAEKTV